MSQQQDDVPKYYMPYDSGEDTDADTEEESDVSDFEDPRIRKQEDPRYAIYKTAGPDFDTYDQQLKYMEAPVGGEYNSANNITSLSGLMYLNAPKTTTTSLFCMKSSNRDKKVYPSPFNFTIKTPRTYKNLTKFQIVQISFPNNNSAVGTQSTIISSVVTQLLNLGIAPCCLATCVSESLVTAGSNTVALSEQSRLNENDQPMLVTLTVPNATYSNPQLATELTEQSNNTPPFNLISYEDFKDAFQTTRDISMLFNEPGELFHSNLTTKRYIHFQKNTIMNCYYTQEHIDSFIEITDKIAFNAYYYPVLKELLGTHTAAPFIQTGPYTFDHIYDMAMNQFNGLDSDFYYEIGQSNREVLDNFRAFRTFRYKNINKYIWTWNEKTSSFSCLNSQLHPSIQRDIQGYLTKCIDYELIYNGMSKFSYTNMKSEYCASNAIFKHLESNLSTILAGYHFVSDYHYKGGIYHSTVESTFHVDDLLQDPTFTDMFCYTSIFGNQYNNMPGIKCTFSTFADYHSTISSYYQKVTELNSTTTGIQEAAYTRHHQYVSKKYKSVLPDSMIETKTYNNGQALPFRYVESRPMYVPGDPIQLESMPRNQVINDPILQPYDIEPQNYGDTGDPCNTSTCSTACNIAIKQLLASWYGCLPVNTEIGSLAYRLGINKLNLNHYTFGLSVFSTVSSNIDYFIQINEEQGFNNMDVAMDENYNITNETVGQVKLMSAKILTGGLGAGELSQTVVQNPIMFQNYLGRLDKLSFKIYYNDGQLTPVWLQIPYGDLAFNEWEATFQIEESIGFADRNTGFGEKPTITIPSNPDAMPYLGLTSADNPNSK